jgi:iron complex outermembrane receptor protein
MFAVRRVRPSIGLFAQRRVKRYALATASIAAICLGTQAQAQELAGGTDVEQVQVTGTRIQRDGYSAPTPVTVIGADTIQADAPANLADYLNTLPAVVGSETPATGTANLSSGGAGVNALNLRDLGVQRTLILIDGHRSPASLTTGEVDINTIPQQLVQRVDVVTGGASADYGSDAVAGVVNFILDTKYTGFKTDLEYGETTYGDQPNYKGDVTWGTDFDGGRGHFLVSGELVTSQEIHGMGPRTWNNVNYHTYQNASATTTNGQPYYVVASGVTPSETTPGGLVISGPLQGTYFGVNAAVGQLAYGAVNGPWMVGGDPTTTCAQYCSTNDLEPSDLRQNIFGRASYQITPGLEIYIEESWSKDHEKSFTSYWPQFGGVTILNTNAFLPASVKATMATDNVTSLNLGILNSSLPELGDNNSRTVNRVLVGADGDVDVLGRNWKYDAYAQDGLAMVHEALLGDWNTADLALAQNAVTVTPANVGTSGLAIGSIACASTLTAPTNGCMPISRVGINGGTQTPAAFAAGLAYVEPSQPYRDEQVEEQTAGINITGTAFDDWAGPVSIAFGGEWRKEAVDGSVPSQYNSGWVVGNYLVNVGHYDVAEGYLEVDVPILKNLDFNAAGRYTNYSTSGGVETWKLGLNYSPIDDIRLRATYSHDIRAPDLSELFAAGTARSNTVLINNVNVAFVQDQTGNKALSPEAANTVTVGAVLTPRFIEGFTLSVDYFNISVAHLIGVISAQNVANLCYIQNIQSYCANINSTGSGSTLAISTINLKPINFSAVKEEGMDFEATYQVPLDMFTPLLGEIPGDLRLHALATNYMKDYTNDGFDPTTEIAGQPNGGLPSWSGRLEAYYKDNGWGLDVVWRGIAAGRFNDEYVQCTTACPAYTTQHYTINNNEVAGTSYFDLNFTYDFQAYSGQAQAFLAIKNVFNVNPVLIATGGGSSSVNTPAFPSTNESLYDLLGRVFRIGVRYNM